MPTPPLPPGFTLDQPSGGAPPLPPGFTLDSQPAPSGGGPNNGRRYVTQAERKDRARDKMYRDSMAFAGGMAKASRDMGPLTVADLAVSGVRGAAGEIAGGLTAAVTAPAGFIPGMEGVGARNYERVSGAIAGQPLTEGGRQAAQVIGYIPEKASQLTDYAGQKAADATGSPLVGTAVRTGLQSIPLLLGRGMVRRGDRGTVRPGDAVAAGAPEAGAAVSAQAGRSGGLGRVPEAAPQVAHPAIQQAQELGYRLQPSQIVDGKPIGGLAARGVERMAGKAALPAELSIKNAEVTKKLIADDFGVPPNEAITPALIDRLRGKANEGYSALERVNKQIDPDVEFFYDLNQLVKESRSALRGNKSDSGVTRLAVEYRKAKDGVPIREVMEEVRRLRFDSRKNYASDKPGTVRLGENQRKVADALEAMIERQVNDVAPDVVRNWRSSRQELARLHTLEDAMKGTEIDPGALAKALRNGEPLSGNMRKIAEVANNFPQVMQAGANLGSKAGPGLLDMAMMFPTAGVWNAGRYGAMKIAARKPAKPRKTVEPWRGPAYGNPLSEPTAPRNRLAELYTQ